MTFGANGVVTVSVTAGGETPTGSVSASIDGGAAVSQSLSGGAASFTVMSPYAGTHTPAAVYTPEGNFLASNSTGSLVVSKATPVVSWANPLDIVYGTALSATQLNATAPIAGTFAYSYPAGTVLAAGTHALSVAFTPTDTANYNGTTATASIVVAKASPVLTWANPANINGGTPVGATQLNATASVPGTFVYTPASGTVLSPGTQTLSVTFTPTNAANYNTVTKTGEAHGEFDGRAESDERPVEHAHERHRRRQHDGEQRQLADAEQLAGVRQRDGGQ